tara:strand:- start:8 stop:862 length:855 start_codon:yes stop_codon:yes gene_type:complete
MSEEEKELEVEIEETAEEKVEPVNEVVEEVEENPAPEEEAPKKPTKFQKRIDDLTHKQREAERQRDEYYKVAQKVMDENNRLRSAAKQYSSVSAKEMESRINAEIAQHKTDYRKAFEDGDAEKLADAQEKMARTASQSANVDQFKQAADSPDFDTQKQAPLAPPPDNRAVEWANRNPWFNQDMVMTNAAYAVHDSLVKQGINPDTEGYYERIDSRMREEFPQKLNVGQTEPSRKRETSTIVTPGGNQTGKARKVRLTPSQVAVARRLGVPLEEYAKQFNALERG